MIKSRHFRVYWKQELELPPPIPGKKWRSLELIRACNVDLIEPQTYHSNIDEPTFLRGLLMKKPILPLTCVICLWIRVRRSDVGLVLPLTCVMCLRIRVALMCASMMWDLFLISPTRNTKHSCPSRCKTHMWRENTSVWVRFLGRESLANTMPTMNACQKWKIVGFIFKWLQKFSNFINSDECIGKITSKSID